MTIVPLVMGPQDGIGVVICTKELPLRVFVGRRWLGDGRAAWSLNQSKRFPCCYALKDGRYYYESSLT